MSYPSRSQKEMVERQRMQQQQLAQQQHGNTQVSPMPNSMVGGGPMGGGFHPENQQVCWFVQIYMFRIHEFSDPRGLGSLKD